MKTFTVENEEREFTYSPDEFWLKVQQYHKFCEAQKGEFPDLAGLKNFLDVDDDEYNAYTADDDYKKYCRWAMRRRESWLNREALKGKNAIGIKMLLAQPENGGYVEKPVDKTPRKMEVVLRGME